MYTHISVCVCMCDSAAVLKVVQHCSVCLLCYYCCCCCNMQCVYCLQLISQSLFTHLLTILHCRYARTLYKYNSLIIELLNNLVKYFYLYLTRFLRFVITKITLLLNFTFVVGRDETSWQLFIVQGCPTAAKKKLKIEKWPAVYIDLLISYV